MLIGMCVCTYDSPDTNCPIFSNRRGSTVELSVVVGFKNSKVARNRMVNCGWVSLIRYRPSRPSPFSLVDPSVRGPPLSGVARSFPGCLLRAPV